MQEVRSTREHGRCILHVGTMKTGTTSIQRWLKDHEQWLRSQGWHYPGWPIREPRTIRNAARESGARNMVISDEALWHFAASGKLDLRSVADALGDFVVDVVVYLRRPDEFLESWFLQGLKAGTDRTSLGEFLALRSTSAATVIRTLDLFASVWGEDRISVLPYEQSQMLSGDVVADFTRRTGLPTPHPANRVVSRIKGHLDPAPRRNVSPTPDLLMIASILRRVFNVPQEHLLKLINQGRKPNSALSPASMMSADEAALIRARFRPVYREVQSRFGSGAEPDFIADWGDDDDHRPVSRLRAAYEEYMAMLHNDAPDADEVGG